MFQRHGQPFFSPLIPSPMTPSFDYIIAGAGCAGLGLVWKMLRSDLRDARILILDPDPKTKPDRTWCFWDTETPELPCPPSHVWDHIALATDQGVERHAIGPHRYFHLEGKAYYDSIREVIAQHPNVEWKQESVLDFESYKSGVVATTPHNRYEASWAFSSIPQNPTDGIRQEQKLQHFHGLFVQTECPVFDPSTVDLMDFRLKQDGDVRFYYVLPFSPTEALIEFTVFSDDTWEESDYLAYLDQYLEKMKAAGSGAIDILRSEHGVIPMTTARFPTWTQARVMNIGIAGGAARPGTGYAFKFIQKRNQEIIQSLLQNGAPSVRPYHQRNHQLYDALLLRVMDNSPERIAAIFSRLFRRHPSSLVLSFLEEKTSLLQDIRIMISLPWAPFLKALFQKTFRLPSVKQTVSKGRTISVAHAHRTP